MNITIYTGDYDRFDHEKGSRFPELHHMHPLESIQWVKSFVNFNEENGSYNILTNSDYIMNQFRILKTQGLIENLTFLYFPFESNTVIEIKSDEKGNLSKWPKGFMDALSDQLYQLILVK